MGLVQAKGAGGPAPQSPLAPPPGPPGPSSRAPFLGRRFALLSCFWVAPGSGLESVATFPSATFKVGLARALAPSPHPGAGPPLPPAAEGRAGACAPRCSHPSWKVSPSPWLWKREPGEGPREEVASALTAGGRHLTPRKHSSGVPRLLSPSGKDKKRQL